MQGHSNKLVLIFLCDKRCEAIGKYQSVPPAYYPEEDPFEREFLI